MHRVLRRMLPILASAAIKPHLETVLGHPSLLRIGRKRLSEHKLKISVEQVSWIVEFTFWILQVIRYSLRPTGD